MYGYVSTGEKSKKSTLDVDDINGASAIYPDTCAAPGAPALSTPADNAGTNDITPTLAWARAAPGATSYRLQVDDSTGFGSPAIDQTQAGASFTPGAALARGTYYWAGTGIQLVRYRRLVELSYAAHRHLYPDALPARHRQQQHAVGAGGIGYRVWESGYGVWSMGVTSSSISQTRYPVSK